MLLLTIISVPLVAVLVHQLIHASTAEPPPPDFGSGSMFDQIASRYDMINRILALRMDVGWRQQMVQVIQSHTKDITHPQLLDVATGTADVALLMAKAIPSATIIGVDPSRGMLDIGRQKINAQGLDSQIRLEWGDAQDFHHLEPSTFDGATMAFGIRNVPQRDVALCQIHRLLKPGAIFTILEFSEPDDSFGLLGRIARLFIRHVVPVLGGMLSGAPREYLHLQNSIKDFPTPEEFAKLMTNLSCADSNGEGGRGGHYEVNKVVQLNFGSVQLYVAKAVGKEAATQPSGQAA